MALLEATAIKSGQQPEQGLVGLPEMKETTVVAGRGIIVFLIAMMVIYFIQMPKLQAFFVLEVHASTVLNQTVMSLKIGYWNMLSLALPTLHMVWQLPNSLGSLFFGQSFQTRATGFHNSLLTMQRQHTTIYLMKKLR